jgi:hypothetical protein
MNNKNNLLGFNIWNNGRINSQSNLGYGLGKMRNTVGSTTRIHKHCSRYSSDPLNCTLGLTMNNSNLPTNPEPNVPATPTPNTPADPPVNLSVPGAPTILNATPGNGEAIISFSAGLNSGPSITNYLYSIDGITYVSSGSISTPITITGLTNGSTYNITLKAVNANGSSIASNSVSVTPSNSGPLAPVLTDIAVTTNDTITITFTQEANEIRITNYKYSIDGGNNYTAFYPPDAYSPVTISGLSSNTTYNIRLKAISSVGDSAASNPITGTTYANVHYAVFRNVGSATWTAPDGITFVQYLVVGGGGGGGATYSKINVLGDVLVTDQEQAGTYWINSVDLTNGRYLGRMYFGFKSGQNSESFADPIRLTASQEIKGSANATYVYNKWYTTEMVYMLSGLVTLSNYFSQSQISSTYCNNVSGGSGGGAGGQVKVLIGAKYEVEPGTTYKIHVGDGGKGGIGSVVIDSLFNVTSGSETNGSPGEDSSFGPIIDSSLNTITSLGGSGGAYSRNFVTLNQDTNKNGKGGNGGQGYGNLVGGSGGGQNTSNNYGKYNSGGAGGGGSSINFDGNGNTVYGTGGNGGVPNTVATETTLANFGRGGNGTGATLNSSAKGIRGGSANGIDGGSGIVIIRYYT